MEPQIRRRAESKSDSYRLACWASDLLADRRVELNHAISEHTGVLEAIALIAQTGGRLTSHMIENHTFPIGGISRSVLRHSYLVKPAEDYELDVSIPRFVYLTDEVRSLWSTGVRGGYLEDALSYVADLWGKAGILTTCASAGLPFPHDDEYLRELLSDIIGTGKFFNGLYKPRDLWKKANPLGKFDDMLNTKEHLRYLKTLESFKGDGSFADSFFEQTETIKIPNWGLRVIISSEGEERLKKGLYRVNEHFCFTTGFLSQPSGKLVTSWLVFQDVYRNYPSRWRANNEATVYQNQVTIPTSTFDSLLWD